MVSVAKNLTNIKLTESDTDGIWLHFEAEDLKADLNLSALYHGDVINRAIQAWAREQLDRTKVVPDTRPSLPVDGGY